MASEVAMSGVGVVVIGRNEGERLRRCFESLIESTRSLVYVDSGSTDGSVALAQRMGIEVVALDMSIPFTAARARNAGFARLLDRNPQSRFVQFVDGDCEVGAGWLTAAVDFLTARPEVACVCGRLRERYPERSVYNRLCDIEWDRPTGQTEACGGIAMMRCDLFASVGGFREDLVAGEEPELCQRLRQRGSTIWRLADHMAWHDAAMLRFGQWWKRSKRVGFGYAQAVATHGRGSERRVRVQLIRPWFWVFILPCVTLAAWFAWNWSALVLLLLYPLQVFRTASTVTGAFRERLLRGAFLLLGKLPEWLGQCQFWHRNRLGKASAANFDYKN